MKFNPGREILEKIKMVGTESTDKDKRTSIGSDKLNESINKVFAKYDKTIKRLSWLQ